MAAGFRTRRVKTEQSIGDKLKRARTRKKISVAEVEEATRIRAKFILALESDSWEQIPSEVYGRGYLETYAHHLQLDKEAIMQQYDRERHMYARHCQEGQVELSPKSKLVIPRFLLTPRFFVMMAVLIFSSLILGGIGKEIYVFASAPYLKIITPVEAKTDGAVQLQVNATSVTISGETAVGAAVTINNQAVEVGSDGKFSHVMTLHSGDNIFYVVALSPNGKNSQQTVSVRAIF